MDPRDLRRSLRSRSDPRMTGGDDAPAIHCCLAFGVSLNAFVILDLASERSEWKSVGDPCRDVADDMRAAGLRPAS